MTPHPLRPRSSSQLHLRPRTAPDWSVPPPSRLDRSEREEVPEHGITTNEVPGWTDQSFRATSSASITSDVRRAQATQKGANLPSKSGHGRMKSLGSCKQQKKGSSSNPRPSVIPIPVPFVWCGNQSFGTFLEPEEPDHRRARSRSEAGARLGLR